MPHFQYLLIYFVTIRRSLLKRIQIIIKCDVNYSLPWYICNLVGSLVTGTGVVFDFRMFELKLSKQLCVFRVPTDFATKIKLTLDVFSQICKIIQYL